jgi:hypothetical protein
VIFVLIAVAWLTVVSTTIGTCRLAARADAAEVAIYREARRKKTLGGEPASVKSTLHQRRTGRRPDPTGGARARSARCRARRGHPTVASSMGAAPTPRLGL